MKTTELGKSIIKYHEGLKLNAYLCPANVPTIGYGNTFYEDGSKVKIGDKVTKQRAEKLFDIILESFEDKIRPMIKSDITDNQFSALVSFAYNIGVTAFSKSTLLRKVNSNPNDESIRAEFMKWNKAKGKVLGGLTSRRKSEADLYFRK